MLKEVIINSVVSILVVLIGLAFAGVRQYLATKGKELRVEMNAEQYAAASKVAKTIVHAVEQVYQDVQGDERLKKALTEQMPLYENRESRSHKSKNASSSKQACTR